MPAKVICKDSWIITTSGTDGACAAAMALQANAEAQILFTSTSRIAGTLLELRDRCSKGTTVSICGVGIGDPVVTLDALTKLCLSGAEVTWYCGRGYMAEFEEEISKRCYAVMKLCASNTEVILQHKRIGKTKQTKLLLDLAAEYAEKKKPASDENTWWHNYIEATSARYFHFGDEGAYPTCIRKLAGLDTVTDADRAMVEKWRQLSGKALPVGSSTAMKRLRSMISRLGPIDEPVLVLGPSGSGKEMVARLLHEASSRSGKPFIPVNCAILSTSSDLAHDRLFGHKEGSYTGAKEDGKGAFETADDGTLFLDEVGELPLEVQTQLLRILEEGTVLPLGTMEPRRVNVRVIAATNRNLALMVEEGTFRLDLYHRLNVLSLDTPPLTERREDMKSIANTVIHQLKENGHSLKISADDWSAINNYSWPGNIRQFINLLKRAAYMKISVAEVLAIEIRRSCSGGAAGSATGMSGFPQLDFFWPQTVEAITPEDDVRKAYMRHCLDLCDGNWTMAAQKLGMAINTLRKWLDA